MVVSVVVSVVESEEALEAIHTAKIQQIIKKTVKELKGLSDHQEESEVTTIWDQEEVANSSFQTSQTK